MTWSALWLETLLLMGAPLDLPPPRVVYDTSNFYIRGEVHVVVDQCFETNAIHEFSHDISVRTGRLNGVPNHLVKSTLEEIAHDVEKRATTWQPNCEGDTQ